MTEKKLDNSAIDTDENLETSDGNLIKIDSQKFQDWLEVNNSFRFVAGVGGCNSYRARKETLRGVNYWYAVKKVNNRLHKKFIGKNHEVTHSKLREVANVIMQPPKTKTKRGQNEDGKLGENIQKPGTTSTDLETRVNDLEKLVNQLTNQRQELTTVKKHETLPDIQTLSSEELEQVQDENRRLREDKERLTNQVTELDNKLTELTNDLSNQTLQQENTRLSNELDKLRNQVNELTNTIDNRDRELEELRIGNEELRQECDSLQTENEELKAIPNTQSLITNDQITKISADLTEIIRAKIFRKKLSECRDRYDQTQQLINDALLIALTKN